uniref:Phosphatidylinositol-specific phospholipase C X domain-containing protein n=1 Tax=Myripristis murdjan TaxID=586833 RepID=A0A667ZEM7_9TELE
MLCAFKFVSCILLFVFFTTSCSGSAIGFNDDPGLQESDYNLNWMESIPDDTPLSAISIPGTHESLTLYGGPLIRCQAWTLDKQLKVGLRYFDVHAGNWFVGQKSVDIVSDSRWMFRQYITFEEVLEIILDFLKVHDSETVLLRVKLHGLYQKKIAKMIIKLITNIKKRVWTEFSVPKLKKVRGKIVFIQSDAFNYGTLNHDTFFPDDDRFRNIEKKIKKVKKYLKVAEENCAHHIVLTDTTATSFLNNPKKVALGVNKQLNDLVVEHKQNSVIPGCLGVITMNFPSSDLIKKIIQIKPCICSNNTVASPKTTLDSTPEAPSTPYQTSDQGPETTAE